MPFHNYFFQPISLLILCLTLLSVAACADESGFFINQHELNKIQKKHDDLIILDVREPHERSGPLGKIEGSLNIPLSQLNLLVQNPGLDKNRHIVILCRTQNRSQAAYHYLKDNGYTNLYVLMGGMSEYKNE